MAVVKNNEIIVYTNNRDFGTTDKNSSLTISTGLAVGYDLFDFNTKEKVGKLILSNNLLAFNNLGIEDGYFTQNRDIWFKNIKVNDELKGPGSLCTTITDSFLDAPNTLIKGEVIQGYSLQGSILNLGKSCKVYSILTPTDNNYGFIIKIKFE